MKDGTMINIPLKITLVIVVFVVGWFIPLSKVGAARVT